MAVGKTTYKDHPTTWYFSIYVQTNTGKKKKIKKEGFLSQRAAFEAENEFLEKLTGVVKKKRRGMLYEVIEEWLIYYNATVKVTTYSQVSKYIDRYIKKFLPNIRIVTITKDQIRSWLNELNNLQLTRSTIVRTVQILEEVFKYAQSEYGMADNPCSYLPVPKGFQMPKKKMSFYTLEQFKKFRSVIQDEEWILFFNMMFYTGMRIGEAQALMVSDYDEERRELVIHRTLTNKLNQGKYVVLDTPKTSKSNRRILIPEWLHHDIKSFLKKVNMRNDHFLLGWEDPFSATNIYRRNKTFAEAAKLHHIRIHDFRHSHASLLINQGADALLVSQRLGHKNVAETLNTYAHLWPNKQKDLINLL